MSYNTTCPHCGAQDRLEVVRGRFEASGMMLTQDGFAFADAKQISTEGERVYCRECEKFTDLGDLTT